MAKLNLEAFKNNAHKALSKHEGQGIFKEHHDTQTTLPIDALETNSMLRYFQRDLSTLKHSVERFGQIEPIVVRKMGDKYKVLNGVRRVAVAVMLGRADIVVDIIEAGDEDALFLPYLLNAHESFDMVEIALYLKALKEQHNLSDKVIEEGCGLKVSDYKDLFFNVDTEIIHDFNVHFDTLLKKYFKYKNGELDIEKSGIRLQIGLNEKNTDENARAELYRFIYRLSTL